MNAIEFKDFSAFYKHKKSYVTALDKINFTVKVGELLVVVGESGCGKSTLLKSCLGLADAYDGELYIDGMPLENVELKSGKFAFVRQEIALYPNLTVYENIAFPLRIMRTPAKEIDRRVNEIAQLMDIPYLLTRKPRQISIGQQQRVAIARALIKNPAFVFLDEPFANIDQKFRRELRTLVKKIHSDLKPTMIFVTHDLTEAFDLAERIIVLEEGKVAEQGAPREIMDAPKSELMKIFFEEKED